MSGQQDPPGDDERRSQEPHGNSLHAGGDIVNSGIMSGRDTHIDNSVAIKVRKWAVANPLLSVGVCAVLVGTIGVGTAVLTPDDPEVDLSVVNQRGLGGARDTLEQIRVAERVADTEAWCRLAQPGDGACATTMSAALGAKSSSYREQVDDVGLGEPEKTDGGARIQLRWEDRDQGYVSLVWTGGRWQLASSDYGLFKLCGAGVFLSLVDAQNQEAKCGPFKLPAS
ncbi:hypothetical protein [Streptomyces sp. HM190]|uniref:hypothetical protein n=1 Tax=Streptomyces sp. HM190 TaxID=2695266 RepID=UPI001359FA01|nr:hypothetical protein [Streptomyces sp. HM190]